MGTRRAALLATLMMLAAPGAALGASVRVPSSHGSVFAVYHRMHRAGLRVTLPRGQTFTNLDPPQVAGSRPAAGQSVPTGSVVALTLRSQPAPRARAWRGRTHRLRLPTLVGARASSIPPLPGVELRLHLTRLDLSAGPGLLFNYLVTRERPDGGSTVEIRHGSTPPRVDFWARQILPPAYPCAPVAGAQIAAADSEAIVTEDSSGQLYGCLRAVGRPFALGLYHAGLALSGHWLAAAVTAADGKYMTCSEQISTVDLSTQNRTLVYDDGCQAGESGFPVAIDDLTIDDTGLVAWRTRSITGETRILTGIACPGGSPCVAVDDHGVAVTSTSPLSGRGSWGATGIEPGARLVGIACPTASVCVAADSVGHALTTSDAQDGASARWSASLTGLTNQSSVACASVHLCLVVSVAGAVATTPNPTTGSWTVTQLGTGPGYLLTAACPTDTRCFVTDGSAVETSGDPQGGAQTWSATTIDAGKNLAAIACPTASECVAADGRGDMLSSVDPTTENWTRTTVTDPGAAPGSTPGVTALSCPDAGHCVAVDAQGYALTSTDPAGPGATWSATRIDTTGAFGLDAYLTGVACTPAQCVATDSDGQTFASPDPFGAGGWTATLTDATPDCAQAPCVAETLWAHDNQGTYVLDAPAPATGDVLSNVSLSAGTLRWSDAGAPRQATLN